MSISCVGQYCRWIFFVATALRERWNLVSIYFVREWCDGFFVSYIVPWLSSNIIVGFVWLNFLLLSKVRSQIISCAKLDNATYSVSVDEKAITEWHFDLHCRTLVHRTSFDMCRCSTPTASNMSGIVPFDAYAKDPMTDWNFFSLTTTSSSWFVIPENRCSVVLSITFSKCLS